MVLRVEHFAQGLPRRMYFNAKYICAKRSEREDKEETTDFFLPLKRNVSYPLCEHLDFSV